MGELTVGQALALGALQGPAELLPVSSSAHLALVPELLGWPYGSLPASVRKSFEVAAHAGAAVGLCWVMRRELRAPGFARGALVSALPAGVAGLLGERLVEARLGSARQVALAQVAAGLALGVADLVSPAERSASDASLGDELLVGAAQAVALVPGASRLGTALTAARLLGFRRADAGVLARRAALPLIAGASGLKAAPLARRGLPRGLGAPFAAGAGAALVATFAAAPLARVATHGPALAALAAYRVALGAAVLRRSR